VRIQVTGSGEWRHLPQWPPVAAVRSLHPQTGGGLGDSPAAPTAAPVSFAYDPADPTPTIGGRFLRNGASGYKDDTGLAERADVVSFTGPVLPEPLEVIGVPVVELAHSSDNPHADLFVRISEVDGKGRSRNVSDCFTRLDPARADGIVHLELDAIAHQFAAGSRIRLVVAGGSFPRFERNLGTGEDPATGTAMRSSRRTLDLSRCRLDLPVSSATEGENPS
jgi:putative CocE/NonD family hydrolase